jgi:hypothetical protein
MLKHINTSPRETLKENIKMRGINYRTTDSFCFKWTFSTSAHSSSCYLGLENETMSLYIIKIVVQASFLLCCIVSPCTTVFSQMRSLAKVPHWFFFSLSFSASIICKRNYLIIKTNMSERVKEFTWSRAGGDRVSIYSNVYFIGKLFFRSD